MNELLLLTAPPASGKTYWIKSFYQALNKKILVISPLRALATELNTKWDGCIEVMTAESYLIHGAECDVAIFDEFHLMFYWGDSFRDKLWQCFFEISSKINLCIGLTATLNLSSVEIIRTWHHFDKMTWIDCGNQILKYNPKEITKVINQKWHEEFILHQHPKKTQIIFCAYREEVESWRKKLEAQGFEVASCVGGMTDQFQLQLKKKIPNYIVSTTCLSHGVNLPSIEAVHLFYDVSNLDFWIQMTARGGRDGSSYKVYSRTLPDKFSVKLWTNLWRNFTLYLVSYYAKNVTGLNEWFLKASLLEKPPTKREISL